VNTFDDQTLVRTDAAPQDPTPEPRSAPRAVLVIAVGGVVLGALGAWWWSARSVPAPRNVTPPVTATEGAVAAPEAAPLPPVDQMDTYLRALIGSLSSNPVLAQWLATDNLIRQMADAIDKVSRGRSPARDVPVLKPRAIFETSGTRGRLTINPASYRRYDALAGAVASLHAEGVAQAYRRIQPRLDEAYRALGRSENGVDTALNVALDVLLATPTVADPIQIVPGKGATYAFADPRLEALSPAQKQLLRMGPQNATVILERLRAIATAIETSR